MAVRRCKKADLKRIAIATGAAFLTSLSNMEGVYHCNCVLSDSCSLLYSLFLEKASQKK
jgi:hypothetical protein